MNISLKTLTSVYRAQDSVEQSLLPEVQGWPFVGALPAMLIKQARFMTEAHQQYGELYQLNLGVFKAVVANHPRHAQHVLRDNARNYQKAGKFWENLRGFLGNGLLTSEGEFWLRQRRMIQPQFHRQRLAALAQLMIEGAEDGVRGWEVYSNQPCDPSHLFATATFGVITKSMFGRTLTEQENERVVRAVRYLTGYTIRGIIASPLPPRLRALEMHKFRQERRTTNEILQHVMDRSRQAQMDGHYEDNLISMLLNVVDEETGEAMSDQQLHDEAVTFFTAGFETTAVTLSWTLHMLLQHPAVLAKLRTEIDTVLGQQRPDFQSLSKLTYTRMVLYEVLRLYSPAWFLPRVAIADDVIDGYRIPAGTTVALPLYVYHRHPDFWEEPEKFDPERFALERSAGRHPFAWIPFGAGQRLCIGRDFALTQAQLILALAFQCYDFALVPGAKVKPQLTATMRPRSGAWVRIRGRHSM